MEHYFDSAAEDRQAEEEELKRKRREALEIGERFLYDILRHASLMEEPAKKKLAPGKLKSVLHTVIQRKGRG